MAGGASQGMSSYPILAVMTGKVASFRAEDEPSAIAKHPVAGAVAVGPLGLAGDEQADLVHHGGVDKAIHHYPHDHYAWWRGEIGDHPLLAAPGGFGENISSEGLTEDNVCLGDRFRLGTALVEVSQGRQPCWKLSHHFGLPQVMAMVVTGRRPGWYYRVLESGEVSAGDRLELVERTQPEWSITRMFGLLIAGDHKREPAALRALAGQPALAQAWRWRANELINGRA